MPVGVLWILANSKTQFRSGEMELSAARDVLAKIPQTELQYWMVWRPGWPDFQSVSEIPELFRQSKATVVATIPAAPIEKALLTTPLHAPMEPDPTQALNRPIERRRHQRHGMRLRAIVQTEELRLRTYTTEISLGGLLLEAPIPERMFGKEIRLYIAGPNGKNSLRFQLLLTIGRHPNFLRLENLDQESRAVFEAWFNMHAPKIAFKVA